MEKAGDLMGNFNELFININLDELKITLSKIFNGEHRIVIYGGSVWKKTRRFMWQGIQG